MGDVEEMVTRETDVISITCSDDEDLISKDLEDNTRDKFRLERQVKKEIIDNSPGFTILPKTVPSRPPSLQTEIDHRNDELDVTLPKDKEMTVIQQAPIEGQVADHVKTSSEPRRIINRKIFEDKRAKGCKSTLNKTDEKSHSHVRVGARSPSRGANPPMSRSRIVPRFRQTTMRNNSAGDGRLFSGNQNRPAYELWDRMQTIQNQNLQLTNLVENLYVKLNEQSNIEKVLMYTERQRHRLAQLQQSQIAFNSNDHPQIACNSINDPPQIACNSINDRPQIACNSINDHPQIACNSINDRPQIACNSINDHPQIACNSFNDRHQIACNSVNDCPQIVYNSVNDRAQIARNSVNDRAQIAHNSVNDRPQIAYNSVNNRPQIARNSANDPSLRYQIDDYNEDRENVFQQQHQRSVYDSNFDDHGHNFRRHDYQQRRVLNMEGGGVHTIMLDRPHIANLRRRVDVDQFLQESECGDQNWYEQPETEHVPYRVFQEKPNVRRPALHSNSTLGHRLSRGPMLELNQPDALPLAHYYPPTRDLPSCRGWQGFREDNREGDVPEPDVRQTHYEVRNVHGGYVDGAVDNKWHHTLEREVVYGREDNHNLIREHPRHVLDVNRMVHNRGQIKQPGTLNQWDNERRGAVQIPPRPIHGRGFSRGVGRRIISRQPPGMLRGLQRQDTRNVMVGNGIFDLRNQAEMCRQEGYWQRDGLFNQNECAQSYDPEGHREMLHRQETWNF